MKQINARLNLSNLWQKILIVPPSIDKNKYKFLDDLKFFLMDFVNKINKITLYLKIYFEMP